MFKLEIETGNDAMRTPQDVARVVADILPEIAEGSTDGVVIDENGNSVGVYEMKEAQETAVTLSLSEYEASILTGALEEWHLNYSGQAGTGPDGDTAETLREQVLAQLPTSWRDDVPEEAFIEANDPLQGRDPDELHERGR